MQQFTKKYAPKKSSEVIGQEKAAKSLKEFIEKFKYQKKKAVILYGPSGCGKTSLVYALANELNCEILEINASDTRNKEQIEEKIGNASKQMSLFMKQKIILIDEIEGVAGNEDRGGISTMISIIESTKFPIIFTTINPYEQKLSALRNKCALIKCEEIDTNSVFSILKEICKKENIEYDELSLKGLARRSGGDVRSAINDLQSIALERKKIDKETLNEIGERDKIESIMNALTRIFKSKDIQLALEATENVEEDYDEFVLWIDENLPKEYKNKNDLYKAYDALSKADVFNGRIKRWQYYRLLVYSNALMTAGVALAKEEKNRDFVQYAPTGRILKLWWAKQKNAKKKAIAEKIALKTHTSQRSAIKDVIPYLHIIFKKNKELREKLAEELDLEKEEIEWLVK